MEALINTCTAQKIMIFDLEAPSCNTKIRNNGLKNDMLDHYWYSNLHDKKFVSLKLSPISCPTIIWKNYPKRYRKKHSMICLLPLWCPFSITRQLSQEGDHVHARKMKKRNISNPALMIPSQFVSSFEELNSPTVVWIVATEVAFYNPRFVQYS